MIQKKKKKACPHVYVVFLRIRTSQAIEFHLALHLEVVWN